MQILVDACAGALSYKLFAPAAQNILLNSNVPAFSQLNTGNQNVAIDQAFTRANSISHPGEILQDESHEPGISAALKTRAKPGKNQMVIFPRLTGALSRR